MPRDVAVQASRLVREFKQRPGRGASLGERLVGRSTIIRAVDDVSVEVAEGSTIGFLGANGAGKSTTIKLLAGLLLPTSGSVRVLGLDPWRDRKACAYLLGVVFGQRSQLVYDTPLISSFRLIRDLYTIPGATYAARLDELVGLLDAESFLDRPVRSLSLGQRMRGDIIASLLPNPRVLFLDEPTIGLDVLAKQNIYRFLDRLAASGDTTILLTSHDMRDIERLCQRVVIVDHGRTAYDGGIAELSRRIGSDATVTVDVEQTDDGSNPEAELRALTGVRDVAGEQTSVGRRLTISYDPRDITTAAIVAAVMARCTVTDLAISGASLDDVIRRLYEQWRTPSAEPLDSDDHVREPIGAADLC